MNRARTLLVVAVLALACLLLWPRSREDEPVMPPATRTSAAASYAGSAACSGCHAVQHAAWRASQHALAMLEPADTSVRGDFNDTRFSHAGVESRFTRRGAEFLVTTDGPDGKLADYPVRYTFGIAPLQQYLLELPGGRLQALSVAWDTRAREQGGQRWFHLYPEQAIPHGDPLHWTGLQQNWNFMCADCHATGLRKSYAADADRYATHWAELAVGCEGCHGPGSAHLAWARAPDAAPGKGLTVSLSERAGIAWSENPATGLPQRNRARHSARELDVCAQCHARRAQVSEDYAPGRPIGDGYEIALLEDNLYWPDGQMRDEVYNHGSFLQSRMNAAGVTCSDCHDPHTGGLRAAGNAVCGQCHVPARYDTSAHHRHAEGSVGAQCAACHLPVTVYMGVDARHDHSLRVPRPERSARLGTPDACSACHRDRNAQWAAQQVREWLGRDPAGFQQFGDAFAQAASSRAGWHAELLAIANDTGQATIVRASALARLAADPTPAVIDAATRALTDRDELVRRAAVDALARDAPLALVPLLDDPVRAVRLRAVRALAAVPPERLAAAALAARARVLLEYRASRRYNADRPEALLDLGTLEQDLGDVAAAEAAYRGVLQRYPDSIPAALNLADLERARGDEPAARAVLEAALARTPESAAAHHALGLALARTRERAQCLQHLAEAVRLEPGTPRFAYVLGVAQHSFGEVEQALATLGSAHERFSGDRPILFALATMSRDAGALDAARGYARQLLELAPDDPQAKALMSSL